MVKDQRVRSHTNILDPCGVQCVWGASRAESDPWFTIMEIGPTARGLGVGAKCCFTTELIYLWPAN